MLQFSRWQTILTLGTVVIGLLFALPNVLNENQRAQIPGFLPSGTINLGLDLRGGSYLLLQVDTEKVLSDRMNGLAQDIRQRFRRNRAQNRDLIPTQSIRVNRDNLTMTVTLRNADQLEDAQTRVRAATRVGGGLGGGVGGLGFGLQPYAVTGNGDQIIVTMNSEAQNYYSSEAVRDSIAVVRRRIDPAGNKEVSIQPQGSDRIVVQVPGDNDPGKSKSAD